MIVKLTDVCDIQYGYAFDSKSFTEDKSHIPLVRIRDVKRGFSETYYSGTYSEEYVVSAGDLLIGMDGEFNIARWQSKDALLNQRVCKIKAKPGVYEEYIRFTLSLKLKEIENRTAFVTVKHLSAKELNKLELELPEYEIQVKIADTLKKIEDVIEKRNAEIICFDELIKSRFVEMFGDLASPSCEWNRNKLIDVCASSNDIKCGPFGTQLSKDEYVDEGIAVWEIPQINNLFMSTPTHYLTEEKAKQLEDYSIKSGDIAMSRKGNVGKCAVFPSNLETGIIHSDVLRIRVDDSRVLPLFMMHQLHYSSAVKRQIELVSAGAIMAGINVTKLKQIYVHIPPMDLQKQFVVFVEHIDKLKFKVQKSLDETQVLFDSLMQKYFG